MKRSVTFLVAVLVVIVSVPAFAAGNTRTANLAVSATVVNNCLITTAPVAFGNYDPVSANAAAGTDVYANGSVTVTCTKNAPGVSVDLGPGLNFSGTRRMVNAGTFLNYELYSANPNPTPGTTWTTGAGGVAVTPTGVTTPNVLTVYGDLFKGQDPIAGTFNDTVVATVNY